MLIENYFSDNIKCFRVLNGWTQCKLAEKLGVSANTVASWEAGTREPHLQHILKLCKVFGITCDELLVTPYGVNVNRRMR